MSAYPPVTFPPPPPTSNTLSSTQRSALVRSAKKLSKILGDVPRVLDDDIPPLPSPSTTGGIRTRTNESIWRKRKPTHLPPLLKPPTPSIHAPDSPSSPRSPMYHHIPTHRGSALSIAPSILSNAPSTASGSSFASTSSDATQRRLRIEHLRRKLGNEVPATAIFPDTAVFSTSPAPLTAVPAPKTPTPRGRTRSRSRSRSVARLSNQNQTDDARSLAFSISSDESVHTVTFTAAHVHSPRPHRLKHVYLTGPLPPVPPIPARVVRAADGDGDGDAGLLRPRVKMAAGSKIGGADFKAARRAKREGRIQNGMAEPGELVEMVGFLRF